MKKSKHTAGTWHFSYDGFNQMSIYSDEQTKCGSKSVVNALSFYAGQEDEQRANAHLISAAPDLLASCHELLRVIEGFIAISQVEPTGFSCYIAAKKAIAKAEGGQR
jgi:hypothetical protein